MCTIRDISLHVNKEQLWDVVDVDVVIVIVVVVVVVVAAAAAAVAAADDDDWVVMVVVVMVVVVYDAGAPALLLGRWALGGRWRVLR